MKLMMVILEIFDLEALGLKASRTAHKYIVNGSDSTRKIADMLHGVWLGHPLHVVLTDITIGAWVFGFVLDVFGFIARLKGVRRTAGLLQTIGILSAVPTALSGLSDYSAVKREAVNEATLHAGSNSLAFLFQLFAWRARWQGKTLSSLFWSGLSSALVTFGSWLGGDLVHRLRVGVNHVSPVQTLGEWVIVADESDLDNGLLHRVEINDMPILVARNNGVLCAIHATCAHAGGPLDEGTIDGDYVHCPWHDSVFDLRTGNVMHGPAVFPQPKFEVRVNKGQVEVRTPQSMNGDRES